jgi:hypothetical protein
MLLSTYGCMRVKYVGVKKGFLSVYRNGILYFATQKGQEPVTMSGSN